MKKRGIVMKKIPVKIVWAIIATAMLLPFIMTIVINAPRVIRWILR